MLIWNREKNHVKKEKSKRNYKYRFASFIVVQNVNAPNVSASQPNLAMNVSLNHKDTTQSNDNISPSGLGGNGPPLPPGLGGPPLPPRVKKPPPPPPPEKTHMRNKSEPEVIHRRSTSDPPPRPAPPDHRKTVAIGTRPTSPESSG